MEKEQNKIKREECKYYKWGLCTADPDDYDLCAADESSNCIETEKSTGDTAFGKFQQPTLTSFFDQVNPCTIEIKCDNVKLWVGGISIDIDWGSTLSWKEEINTLVINGKKFLAVD